MHNRRWSRWCVGIDRPDGRVRSPRGYGGLLPGWGVDVAPLREADHVAHVNSLKLTQAHAYECRFTDPAPDAVARGTLGATLHDRHGVCQCSLGAGAVCQRRFMGRTREAELGIPGVQTIPNSSRHVVRRIRSRQLDVKHTGRHTRVITDH